MKLLIITVLIMMLIWQGCYSYFSVSSLGESQRINFNNYDAEDIQVDLVDGTEITSNAGTHSLVTEPSDFIMGIGTLSYSGQVSSKEKFYKINANDFDSVAISKFKNADYETCYLKDGSQIHYQVGSYLRVSPKDGVGYIILGKVEKDGIKEIKTSRVELNQIKDVEIKEIDGLKTAGVTILTLGILFIGILATSDFSFHIFDKPSPY